MSVHFFYLTPPPIFSTISRMLPMYVEPEVPAHKLKEANIKHDTTKHIVCMDPKVRYKGGFAYPSEREPTKRRRLIRFVDEYGQIQMALK